MQLCREVGHACRAPGASGGHQQARPTPLQPTQPIHRPSSAPRTQRQQPAPPAHAAGRQPRRARPQAEALGTLRMALETHGLGRPRRPAPWQACLPLLYHGQPISPRTLAAMEAVGWRGLKTRARPARLSPLPCGRLQMQSSQTGLQRRLLETVMQRLAMRPMQRARIHRTSALM